MSVFVKPQVALLLAAVVAVLLLAVACEPESYFDSPYVPVSMPVPTPTPLPLAEDIPPCTPIEGASQDPCVAGDTPADSLSAAGGYPSALLDEVPTSVRETLDGTISFVPHIVVRATYIPDTARCTSGNLYRPPAYTEEDLFEYSYTIQCYVDVRANSYILGNGPARQTVLTYVHHYWEGSFAPDPDNPNDLSEAERLMLHPALYVSLYEGTAGTGPGIYGLEQVLFLAPADNQGVEVWQRVEGWDVERDADDPDVVRVIHRERDIWRDHRPEDYQTYRHILEPTLADFTASVRAAHAARVAEYGGRVGPWDMDGRALGAGLPMLVSNINQIDEFLRSVGAYHHPDGPPTQPPLVCGPAVPDGSENAGLISDCLTLMALRDALRGDHPAALNWDASISMASWDGITIGRWASVSNENVVFNQVTKIKLPGKDLRGAIPAGLGDVLALTELDLSNNQLTGEIPPELGRLEDLAVLRLSGNFLTGCIPPALRDVATNDLSSLNLPYCADSPGNLRETSSGETRVSVSWDAVPNAAKYRVESLSPPAPLRWAVASESVTGISHTVTGLTCYEHHGVRVSAYGDGPNRAAAWGEPSKPLSVSTTECLPPTFNASSYAFSVPTDAEGGSPVGGQVSAIGSEGADDSVAYSITQGDEDGKFAIDAGTGKITVAGDLSAALGTSFTLTVEAVDESGDGDGDHRGDQGVLQRHGGAQSRCQPGPGERLQDAAGAEERPGGHGGAELERRRGDDGLGRCDGPRLAQPGHQAGPGPERADGRRPAGAGGVGWPEDSGPRLQPADGERPAGVGGIGRPEEPGPLLQPADRGDHPTFRRNSQELRLFLARI